jgi:histidinol-phosphate aminotransferase
MGDEDFDGDDGAGETVSTLAPLLRLSHNENAYGPSPRVKALAHWLGSEPIARYADPESARLVALLAERYGCTPAELMVGSGSSELIELLCKVHGPGRRVVLAEPAFPWYRQVCDTLAIPVDSVPLGDDGNEDVARIVAACGPQTSLVFVTNPNNPTGTYFTIRHLFALLDQVPAHVHLVLDEAYAEYADAPDFVSALGLRRYRERLVVLRTFSKAYGLAGARIGWGVGPRELAERVRRTRSPYSLNYLAEALACEALRDEGYVQECARRNAGERRRLANELIKLGVHVHPSQANFFMADFGLPSRVAYDHLRRLGIETRLIPGSERWLRVSLGTDAENRELVARLAGCRWLRAAGAHASEGPDAA